MRRPELQPGSPAFKDQIPHERACDVPGCAHAGEYRAPKSRYSLRDYYWFCLNHVRDYNARWDFCEGMTPAQIDSMIKAVATWDRPTHKMAPGVSLDPDVLRNAIYRDYAFSARGYYDFDARKKRHSFSDGDWSIPESPSQELEALAVMGLEPPVTLETIKERYKFLVKKYHPDINEKTEETEELIKKINIAYSVLKVAYQRYTDLEAQT